MENQNFKPNFHRTSQMVAQMWFATLNAILTAEKATNLEVLEVLNCVKEKTANVLESLPGMAKNVMADRTEELVRCVIGMVQLIAQNDFFTAVEDDEHVPSRLIETYAKWKELATDMGYFGPILWEVKAGFTLRTHAPLIGPCFGDFTYMQDWKLVGDSPTTNCLVFFVPRAVSVGVEATTAINLAILREKYGLPERHCDSFGSAALVGGLILSYYNLTGERLPNDCGMVRTSTIFCRDWLCVGSFDNRGLYCQSAKYSGARRRGGVGVFPIGVEYTS